MSFNELKNSEVVDMLYGINTVFKNSMVEVK